jgi:hypothetical protein
MLNFLSLISVVLFSTVSFAQNSAPQSCVAPFAKYPPFRLVSETTMSKNEISKSISGICDEVENREFYQSKLAPNGVLKEDETIEVLFEVVAGFDSMEGSALQKEFKAKATEIQNISNMAERLRRSYELVLEYEGSYDGTNSEKSIIVFPGDTIDRAKATGTGGVCRHFSSLAHWTMMHNVRSNTHEYYGSIDYRPELFTTGNHMMNQVYLNPGPNSLDWEKVDFDLTNFKQVFTPLFPLFDEMKSDTRTDIQNSCAQIKKCLEN